MKYVIESGKAYPIIKNKGWYSKIIVGVCILLAVSYTGFCLVMQYKTGTQPEPQLTIAFFAFISVELWNLAKIKRHKDSDKTTKEKDE